MMCGSMPGDGAAQTLPSCQARAHSGGLCRGYVCTVKAAVGWAAGSTRSSCRSGAPLRRAHRTHHVTSGCAIGKSIVDTVGWPLPGTYSSGGSSGSTTRCVSEAAPALTDASQCLRSGRQLLQQGSPSAGVALLLRAQRLGSASGDGDKAVAIAAEAADAVETAYRAGSGYLVPTSALRAGSLLLREPPGQGCRCKPVRAAVSCAGAAGQTSGVSTAGTALAPEQPHKWRYEPWLCGGFLPRVDCASLGGFQEALAYIARREPVVMLNLGLLPSASKWNIEYLRDNATEWPGMNVLRSPCEDNRYLYYVSEQADRDMAQFRGAPRHASEDVRMSFSSFLMAAEDDPDSRYYLQAPVVLREVGDDGVVKETWNRGLGRNLRADCDHGLNRSRLEQIQTAGIFDHWSRSQLFVGPCETLSPVHYDQYDNVFLQVCGYKHFLLFDPGAAEGLYPFPVSHPYDEYAMLNLEQAMESAVSTSEGRSMFPRAATALAGRGAAATLGPGESLYIPTHWWHHVQGCAPATCGGRSSSAWSISVNFWFSITRTILEPPYPLPSHLELELARHVEFLLGDHVASITAAASRTASSADPTLRTGATPASIETFAALLVSESCNEVDDPAQPSSGDDFGWPVVRNFIFFRLARLLGPANVRAFLLEHFPPERFDRVRVRHALKCRHDSVNRFAGGKLRLRGRS